ncbi:HrcA family transcriptional regulator [Thermostichus vulcanus]|uniref:Heat-inducible transcription repressor HrcA n=1 Tax=Thermostichus vulcanus str. 'Rupite' TaxID=2813851 RepID=A0ABT0CDJ1_THEVL|nr:heat-inducible transcriptional repressor HrcA [Thermostichus vulcanus]MCJ2543860.1 heat-inducible transcriptional repressor HrcA [Thermostichus vulcanus str. 'Rupite']
MRLKLTPRQRKILWATVRSYIATAEPVGSKTLAQSYDLGVSTATIRNDLATLEQVGLLFQPHTSAGRIPSDFGYRVYVNDLLATPSSHSTGIPYDTPQPAPHPALQRLMEQLNRQLGDDLDSLLQRVAQLLAHLSGCIALITPPQGPVVAIHHVQLVAVSPGRVMVLVVTDSYQTYSAMVSPPEWPSDRLEDELQLLSNFLTLKLRGKTFAELQDLSWLKLDEEFRTYGHWLQQLLRSVVQRYLQPPLGQVFSAGMTELMRQPEFSQAQQVQAVVQLIEEGSQQLQGMIGLPPMGGVTPQPQTTAGSIDEEEGNREEDPHHPRIPVIIYIGSENPLESLHHCTVIASTYHRRSSPLGTVTLLGPTRMAYERSIAAVQAVASHLTRALA